MASGNTNQLLLYGGGLVVLVVGGYLAYTYLIKGKSTSKNRSDSSGSRDSSGSSGGDWCASHPGRCGSGGRSHTGSGSGSDWCTAHPGQCGDKSTTSSLARISVS